MSVGCAPEVPGCSGDVGSGPPPSGSRDSGRLSPISRSLAFMAKPVSRLVVVLLPSKTNTVSPVPLAASASARVSNGVSEVPSPPAGSLLRTYQTWPVSGRLSVPVEFATVPELQGELSQTR